MRLEVVFYLVDVAEQLIHLALVAHVLFGEVLEQFVIFAGGLGKVAFRLAQAARQGQRVLLQLLHLECRRVQVGGQLFLRIGEINVLGVGVGQVVLALFVLVLEFGVFLFVDTAGELRGHKQG